MFNTTLHEHNSKKHRRKARVLTTVLFVGVLALCFFLTAFTIQDPPPGEQFVAVGFTDLGSIDEAGGDTETDIPSEIVEEVVEEIESIPTVEEPIVAEEVVTQETSEMSLPAEVEEEEEEEHVVEPVRTSAGANLVSSSVASGGGGSQGDSEGVGNQGDEDGKIDGSGVVSGDFGAASLDGGSLVSAPRLSKKPEREGDIRMKIIVDSNGKVISAVYDPVNSTFADSEHIRLARIASLTATFTSNASKPRRSGFITIRFELE